MRMGGKMKKNGWATYCFGNVPREELNMGEFNFIFSGCNIGAK